MEDVLKLFFMLAVAAGLAALTCWLIWPPGVMDKTIAAITLIEYLRVAGAIIATVYVYLSVLKLTGG
jgi:hypothetical protein